jgi:hypothetical protein
MINGGFGSDTCFFDSGLDLVQSCPYDDTGFSV